MGGERAKKREGEVDLVRAGERGNREGRVGKATPESRPKSNFQLCSSQRSVDDYEHPVSLLRQLPHYIYILVYLSIYAADAVGNQSKAYKTSNDLLHFSHCVHKLSETNRRGRQKERERGRGR